MVVRLANANSGRDRGGGILEQIPPKRSRRRCREPRPEFALRPGGAAAARRPASVWAAAAPVPLNAGRNFPPDRPATRDEYLFYFKHLNMLTLAMVGGRRGQTVIDIEVLDDGTVATLKVGQSSGYPDIDRQVEAMIHAVGRLPPLPQWFQGPSMQLEFRIKFPEALED